MSIKIRDLEAVSLAMAKHDVRFYLNGVLFDVFGQLVATDGAQMHVVNTGVEREDKFIMHRADVLKIIKSATPAQRRKGAEFSVSFDYRDSLITVTVGEVVFECSAISANYPDYSRVWPDLGLTPQPSDALGLFNFERLAVIQKAAGIQGGRKLHGMDFNVYADKFYIERGDFRAVVMAQRG